MERIATFFLKNRAFSWLLLLLVVAGGIFAYVNMGKLEDAPFTIKQAVVTTSYYVKKEIRADEMQQLWDKLRRKEGDAQSKLPAGAGPSVVNDDFGDVLGVFYGLSSSTHSYRELEDEARRIKNEILTVKDVAKVELCGVQNRTIEVSLKPSVLAVAGVTVQDIASAFEKQNKIVDAGAIETTTQRLRVEAGGSFSSLEELQNLTVVAKSREYFRLGEIADISES